MNRTNTCPYHDGPDCPWCQESTAWPALAAGAAAGAALLLLLPHLVALLLVLR
jgi:hypothetical protein